MRFASTLNSEAEQRHIERLIVGLNRCSIILSPFSVTMPTSRRKRRRMRWS